MKNGKKESASFASRKFLLCLFALCMVTYALKRQPDVGWGMVIIGILAQYGWFNVQDKKVLNGNGAAPIETPPPAEPGA